MFARANCRRANLLEIFSRTKESLVYKTVVELILVCRYEHEMFMITVSLLHQLLRFHLWCDFFTDSIDVVMDSFLYFMTYHSEVLTCLEA